MTNAIEGQKTQKIDVECHWCQKKLRRNQRIAKGAKKIKHFFCNKECKGEWQRTQKPVDREWLYDQYIVQGRTAPDIAKEVGRHSKRVWEWLRDYGIETRPRGSHEPNLFKKGHKLCVGRVQSESTRQKIREARIRDGSKGLFKTNGDHVLKGRVGPDHPSWRGGLTPDRQAFYGSREWKDAYKHTWQRADAICERCGLDHRSIDRLKVKFHVHHIVTFQHRELRAVLSNLALLCDKCHRFVHSKKNEAKEFIKEIS